MNERVFFLDDIGRLIQKKKKPLFWALFLGSLLGLATMFREPPLYKIEATFKEGPDQGGIENTIKDFLIIGFKTGTEAPVSALMQSNQVLRPLIELHGLQAEVSQPDFSGACIRYFLAEIGKPLPENHWFTFANVSNAAEVPLRFFLKNISNTRFQVLDAAKQMLGELEIGVPFYTPLAQFTLTTAPSLTDKHYTLTIAPWTKVIKKLKKRLKIAKQKATKEIYDLTLEWPDRTTGVSLLNGLMEEYRHYLKRDYNETATEQLAYLSEKQSKIYGWMEQVLQEHATYLSTSLREKGVLGIEEATSNYLQPHQEIKNKLLGVEVEIARLKEGSGSVQEGDLGVELAKTLTVKHDLERERNQLTLLGEQELIASNDFPSMHPQKMDLEVSRELIREYENRFDAGKAKMQLLEQMKDRLDAGEFEPGSLTESLKDSLSQNILQKATAILLELEDEKYHSAKEKARSQEEFTLQKKILSEHLDQLWKMEEMNMAIYRQQISSLQRSSIAGIDQKIAALEEELQRKKTNRIEILEGEKQLLTKKMEDLRNCAADLPERWKLENWLEVKTDLGKKIMTVLTELIESKTAEHHLHRIQSKPLDPATLPFLAQSPSLFFRLVVGALSATFAVFFSSFAAALYRGFPATGVHLRKLNLPFCGEIAEKTDLETFREIALFLERAPQTKRFGLILRNGTPDYALAFANHFAVSGKRILLIDCSFAEKNQLGLLQLLAGETISPQKKGSVDVIPSGGIFSHGPELLQTDRFQSLLSSWENIYDAIFLMHRIASLNSASIKFFLRLVEKAVVPFEEEQTEQLTPLLDWAYHEENCRITFIHSRP